MKRRPILITLIVLTVALACKQKPKTEQEIFQASMEGKTDEDLTAEMYGYPQNYEIIYSRLLDKTKPYPTLIIDSDKGGVLQVMYNKDKIFIEGFSSLAGSYKSKRYASPTGNIIVKFEESEGFAGAYSAGLRAHPKDSSKGLIITFYTTENKLEQKYVLRRLE